MLAEEDVDASACPDKKPLRSHVACTLQASDPRCDDCQVVLPCLLQFCQLAGAPSASSADLLAWQIWATPTAGNSKPALTLCVARLLSMVWRNICWWKRSLHISKRCCVQRGLSPCPYWQNVVDGVVSPVGHAGRGRTLCSRFRVLYSVESQHSAAVNAGQPVCLAMRT